MQYPCITYEPGVGDRKPADNKKYLFHQGYTITLITKNEDPPEIDEILELQYCTLERPFKADNLYHWVFFIYF